MTNYGPMLETGAAIGASRLTVGGDSADFAAVGEQARRDGGARPALSDRGRPRIHAVPAGAVARACGRRGDARPGHPNAHILIDALHVFRSGTSPQAFAGVDPAMLAPIQLCDAPAQAPPPDRADRRGGGAPPAARRRRACTAGADRCAAAGHSGSAWRCRSPGQRPDLDPGARLALLVGAAETFSNGGTRQQTRS